MEEAYTLKRPGYIKRRKRVGRGNSSGHGSQACKGHDGQLSRSGKKHRAWFEGGQMPLQRRVPKRGFTNFTRKEYQVINLVQIERLGLASIDPAAMKTGGVIGRTDRLVKVLGKGELSRAVQVTADAFSGSAIEKIKKAGGEVTVRAFPLKQKADA